MTKTKSRKKRTVSRTHKRKLTGWKRFLRLPYVLLVGIGIIILLTGMAVLNFNLTEKTEVTARTGVPVETFQTSYKGYNTSTSWMSWLSDAQRCSKTQKIYGAKPVAAGDYPVLIYLHGATADWSGNREGREFIERAAAQGFIALAPTYKSGGKINERRISRHAYCMFDQNHPNDAMTAICKTADADCTKGVLVAGFSQGGTTALVAKNYNSSVKAVWTLGVSAYIYYKEDIPKDAITIPNGTRLLPNNKLVMNIGQATDLKTKDLISADLPSLKAISGKDCGNSYECLKADGSGYYIVKNSEIKDGVADHCYWLRVNSWSKGLSCTIWPSKFDPGFQPPATTEWSIVRNLEWLRSQL